MAETKDARGVIVKPGDVVVYGSNGKYGSRGVAIVASVKGSRIYLGDYEAVHGWRPAYTVGTSCVVVTGLPPVEGRINAGEVTA